MHVIVSWNYQFASFTVISNISLLSVFCGCLGLGLEGYGLGLGLEAQVLGLGVSGLVNITGAYVRTCGHTQVRRRL